MLRIGADLGLFGFLTKSGGPLTVDQLAKLTGASPELLGEDLHTVQYICRTLIEIHCVERILRYLAATDMIKETGANQYSANSNTYVLADPKGEAMVYHT